MTEIDETMVTEGMRDQRLPPRLCAFVTKAFRDVTGLTVDDLYQGSRSSEKQEKRVLFTQINYLVEKLNKLRSGDEKEYCLAQE